MESRERTELDFDAARRPLPPRWQRHWRMQDDVLAVILGGGKGRRLLPLTEQRCKPAVPIGGKYRLADIPISNCINSGIRSIYVLTQYRSASLNRHISQTYAFDNFANGFVDVLAADQTVDTEDWFQGPADAVRRNISQFNAPDDVDVIVMNGDILFRLDLRQLLEYHRTRSADITMLAAPAPREEAGRFGIVKMDPRTRATDYCEKPNPSRLEELAVDAQALERFHVGRNGESPYLASIGVYVFRMKALRELLSGSSAVDFGHDVLPRAVQNHKVYVFLYDGYWRDLGTIRSFYQANLDLAKATPLFSFYDASSPIYTRPRFLPPSKLLDCHVENTLISEGCLIHGGRIRNSVIGVRSIIRKGAQIENSILMGADDYDQFPIVNRPSKDGDLGVGEDSIIQNAIVDKDARIGRGCRIVNDKGRQDADHDLYFIRDGIVIIRKKAVIPDEMII